MADTATTAPEEQENFFQNIGAAASSHAEGSQVGGIDNDGIVAAETDGLTEIENTLCVQCGATGTTRMLLTMVPFFREIVVMSFTCDACGFRNSEVSFGGEIQQEGVTCTLNVADSEDLNRECIKSDSARVIVTNDEGQTPLLEGRAGEECVDVQRYRTGSRTCLYVL